MIMVGYWLYWVEDGGFESFCKRWERDVGKEGWKRNETW